MIQLVFNEQLNSIDIDEGIQQDRLAKYIFYKKAWPLSNFDHVGATHLLAVRDGGLLGDPAGRRAEGGPQLRW